jgi:hypothetical protein
MDAVTMVGAIAAGCSGQPAFHTDAVLVEPIALISASMPSHRFYITLPTPAFEVTRQIDDAMRRGLMAGLEHKYYL